MAGQGLSRKRKKQGTIADVSSVVSSFTVTLNVGCSF